VACGGCAKRQQAIADAWRRLKGKLMTNGSRRNTPEEEAALKRIAQQQAEDNFRHQVRSVTVGR
jgi:hypothetical protein